MKRGTVSRAIVLRFVVAGFLVASVIYGWILLSDAKLGGDATTYMLLVVWPTMPFLMSAEAGGAMAELLAFFFAAASNAVVYGLVGLAVAFIYSRFFLRTRPSSTDSA